MTQDNDGLIDGIDGRLSDTSLYPSMESGRSWTELMAIIRP